MSAVEQHDSPSAAPGPAAAFPAEDPKRILNREEIDSLFGRRTPADEPGLEKLISTPNVSYERLPMLEVVFDRFARALTTNFRNLTSDSVEVSMDHMTSERFGDYLDQASAQSMFVVFRAEEWDGAALLVLSSSLIYAVVNALLGGRDAQSAGPAAGRAGARSEDQPRRRPHTAIERALVEPIIRIALADLSTAFSPLCAVNFRFERLELNPRFAAITRSMNGVVLTRFRVGMDGGGGDMDLILPHATLEPVRDLLIQQFMGERLGHDGIWESHLATELWQTDLTLEAVLQEQVMTLGDILRLSPGDQLVLRRDPDAFIQLRCDGKVLFRGSLGKKRGNIAVRIEETLIGGGDVERPAVYR